MIQVGQAGVLEYENGCELESGLRRKGKKSTYCAMHRTELRLRYFLSGDQSQHPLELPVRN